MNAPSADSLRVTTARRWSQLTSNLIVSALIVMIALVVGREVVRGWQNAAGEQRPVARDTSMLPQTFPYELPLSTITFEGSQAEAEAHLIQLCQRACDGDAALPNRGTLEAATLQASRLVASTDWYQIYRTTDDPPLLAVVSPPGEENRTVYVWAMVAPAGEDAADGVWNLSLTSLTRQEPAL